MPRLSHEFIVSERDGSYILCVRKARGKITVDELGDYLRYDARLYGHWVVILNASEGTCDVGWPEDEPKGDMVALHQIEYDATCPVCLKIVAPEYCPHCGEKIMEDSRNG